MIVIIDMAYFQKQLNMVK
ncbi:Protein of unknown function [Bacillus mycoides]|uniref:Uncharacterized protein n=1 Tax=Bacillus mycoides TaxID=1405 RepID=A0A1D3MH63_BACMY|nr:Protein of unknown function [Bacillus mycoides]SCM85299.1 Protein of unknown function [Bacillus mycoides]